MEIMLSTKRVMMEVDINHIIQDKDITEIIMSKLEKIMKEIEDMEMAANILMEETNRILILSSIDK